MIWMGGQQRLGFITVDSLRLHQSPLCFIDFFPLGPSYSLQLRVDLPESARMKKKIIASLAFLAKAWWSEEIVPTPACKRLINLLAIEIRGHRDRPYALSPARMMIQTVAWHGRLDSACPSRFRARNTHLLPEPAANDVSHARMKRTNNKILSQACVWRERGRGVLVFRHMEMEHLTNSSIYVAIFLLYYTKVSSNLIYQHTPNHLDRTVRDRPIG
jgi:hypothetical protein